MKPEKQRIAIAEYCGQDRDYINSLDAMHEAEQSLWDRDWGLRAVFVDNLARIINPAHGYCMQSGLDLLDATAAQRAEAFLRTVGRWDQ